MQPAMTSCITSYQRTSNTIKRSLYYKHTCNLYFKHLFALKNMNEVQQNNDDKRKNRKRKKSVLKNARKYAKQGKYGRGSKLDEDKYQYFVRVLELWRDGFETDEEKLIFVKNVFEETTNEEIHYSSNQIGCRVIELLLPFADDDIIFRYIEAFSDNLRVYLSDRFASHVLQTLLKLSCKKTFHLKDETLKLKYKQFTLKVSKFLLNNLEDFITDLYANHIIRSVFEALTNLPETPKNTHEKKTTETEIKKEDIEIPDEYADVVKEFAIRLSAWPHFKDLPYNELSSGLLQILLVAVKEIDLKLLKKIIKKLTDESFSPCTENTKIPDVFSSKPATILLESALCTATPKLFTQLYAKCFVGNLVELSKMKGCNMSVQKLISKCEEKTEFEEIFNEVADYFEDILNCGHTGVVLALAQTCKRLQVKQGNFVQSLMKALHCSEPRERETSFIPATIHLVPYEKLETLKTQHYFVNLHGSVIIQLMLEFNKPIKLINSLLSMEHKDLVKLFCDPKGSHIIDSYMGSVAVGEKSREKLIYKMMGTYQEMAISKYGSRSLEAVWSASNLKQRSKIMEELSYKDGLWTNTDFGKIIANKLHFQLYKRNKNEWNELMEKSKMKKTKEMFTDIIGTNDK